MPGRGIRLNWNAAILVVLVWISQCLVPWESYAARFYGLNSSGDVRMEIDGLAILNEAFADNFDEAVIEFDNDQGSHPEAFVTKYFRFDESGKTSWGHQPPSAEIKSTDEFIDIRPLSLYLGKYLLTFNMNLYNFLP